MKKERIIAAFKCPICDHDAYAVGFAWRCTRKGCQFTMGRSWKNDPDGSRYFPKREYWQGARDRYREAQGLPFETYTKIKFPDIILYKFEMTYPTHDLFVGGIPYYKISLYSETVWGPWTGDEKSRGRVGKTDHFFESLPKKTKEEALATAKAWLKANGGQHVKLVEDVKK